MLSTRSKRHAFESLSKVQISPYVVVLKFALKFANYTVLPMEIPCQFDCHFYSKPKDMILSHTVGREPNESQMKKLNLIRDKAFRND